MTGRTGDGEGTVLPSTSDMARAVCPFFARSSPCSVSCDYGDGVENEKHTKKVYKRWFDTPRAKEEHMERYCCAWMYGHCPYYSDIRYQMSDGRS